MTLISPHDFRPITSEPSEPEHLPKRRDFQPAPGRVSVLRVPIPETFVKGGLIVNPDTTSAEVFNLEATVARIGDTIDGGTEPWFSVGDLVVIEPSLFREVQLAPGLSVWNGPFAAIQGRLVEIQPNYQQLRNEI